MSGFNLKDLPETLDVFTEEALGNFLDNLVCEQEITILDLKTDEEGNIYAPIAKGRFDTDTVEESDYKQVLSKEELYALTTELELINDVAIMNSERD